MQQSPRREPHSPAHTGARPIACGLALALAGCAGDAGSSSGSGSEGVTTTSAGGSTTGVSASATAKATWFDPRTGAAMAAEGGPSYTAPGPGDWALYVEGG